MCRHEIHAPFSQRDLTFEFDAEASSWDAHHGPASARQAEFAARIRYLREVCRTIAAPSVLDLGCGTGQVLSALADLISRGVGVDISPAMIGLAPRGDRRLQFVIADPVSFCANCPERFDLVFLIGVLEHLADPSAVLRSTKRLLTETGRLIIISPHPWNPGFRLKRLFGSATHEPRAKHQSPFSLAGMAARQGFEMTQINPLPYAAWRQLGREPHRAHQLRRAALIPRILVGILAGAFAAQLVPTHEFG